MDGVARENESAVLNQLFLRKKLDFSRKKNV